MKVEKLKSSIATGLFCAGVLATPLAVAQEAPKVQIPDPGVPEIMTLQGRYVRIAYNREGYVTLGYKLAQLSVGEEWMLLEVGMTVRDDVPDYTLKREAISIETPDGATIPMATIKEYREGDLRALQMREKVQRDPINYFPPSATQACRLGFFAELSGPAMAFDQVDLSSHRGCFGRIYFKIPGKVTYGQHWLNVKFEKSVVRVPFRILTKEEDKMLDKNFKSIKKQVDDAFRPPKKK